MRPTLFAATLFAAAGLLFTAQPLIGKQLLPLAGGSPAVWAGCLVFFQAVLLLGYLYAHAVGKLTPTRQGLVHLPVLAAAGVWLALGDGVKPNPALIPDTASVPAVAVLLTLAAAVGPVAFALSTTAPLLQNWFAARSVRDPYPLYAASNAGSLLGLLGYPLLVEPTLPVDRQRELWLFGFVAVGALVGVCFALTAGGTDLRRRESGDEGTDPRRPPGFRDLLRWAALAALPSSLLTAVTTHLTTDVAPVPLLWVVPLALYLVTWIITFARWPATARRVVGRATPMVLLAVALALLTKATDPLVGVAAVHLAGLVAVALLCHGELAASRPPAAHLTAFYLATSVGGVLGGGFNALVAPHLFADLGNVEYPLALCLAGLVRPREADEGRPPLTQRDLGLVALFAVLAVGMVLAGSRLDGLFGRPVEGDEAAPAVRLVRSGVTFGVPAMVAFALVRVPVRFALCLGALFLAGALDPGSAGRTVLVARNFFGTLRVAESADGKFTRLLHGTTLHGQEHRGPDGRAVPSMYYHRTGPIGRLLDSRPAEKRRRVAAVGLGVGALAAYSRSGETWTYYEIDPGVVRIARGSGYFHFLSEARGEVQVVLGDARRQLAREPDGAFDLIILDAFSSDAIPAHLLTTEAFAVYAAKLAPGGVLAFHLSNRYLDLPPLVARVAAAQNPPFVVRVDHDETTDGLEADGKFDSVWAAAVRDFGDLGPVAKDPRWQKLDPPPGPVWRDDFSDLLGVWKRDED
ncbi:MAG: fused MFS/spermidine synthase [Gemmataceae bacterium]